MERDLEASEPDEEDDDDTSEDGGSGSEGEGGSSAGEGRASSAEQSAAAESSGSDGEQAEEDPATLARRVSRLVDIRPPRPIGPVEELIGVANTHYAKSELTMAVTIYQRALNMIERSGKCELHDEYIACCLNLGEALLHLDETDRANSLLQPVLLKVGRALPLWRSQCRIVRHGERDEH